MADGSGGMVVGAVILVVVAAFITLGVVAYRSLGLSGEDAERLAERRRYIEESRQRSTPALAVVVSTRVQASEYQGGDFGVYREITGTVEVGGGSHPIAWDVQSTAVAKLAPDATVEVLVDPQDATMVHPAKPWARPTVRVAP